MEQAGVPEEKQRARPTGSRLGRLGGWRWADSPVPAGARIGGPGELGDR